MMDDELDLMLPWELVAATEHQVASDLRKSVEDAILNVAARPPGLRGPWVMDEAWLQQAAKNIRKRRALAQRAKP